MHNLQIEGEDHYSMKCWSVGPRPDVHRRTNIPWKIDPRGLKFHGKLVRGTKISRTNFPVTDLYTLIRGDQFYNNAHLQKLLLFARFLLYKYREVMCKSL